MTLMGLMFARFDFELVDPDNEPGYGSGLTLPASLKSYSKCMKDKK